MIKSLKLTNFKSVGKTLIAQDDSIEEGKLEFAPLTIFCGKNSSGKSTVLQSILLLAQTLQSNVPSQALVLNGPMIKLGNINDIRTEFYKLKDIDLCIEYLITETISQINEIDADYYRTCQTINQDEQLGYFEKKFFIDELQHLFKYSFSNSFKGIKEATFERTGYNLSIKKSEWKPDPLLSESIKEFMIKNHLKYSMTNWHEGGISNIIINKRENLDWYYISIAGVNGIFISDSNNIDELNMNDLSPADMHNFSNKIKRLNTIKLSFNKKIQKDFPYDIPVLTNIKLQSSYLINNGLWVSTFHAIINKNPPKIEAERNDFEFYNFVDERYVKNLTKEIIIENKKIGLKLNHFLPENMVYYENSIARAEVKRYIDDNIKCFITNKYIFDEQSMTNFIENINNIIKVINYYETNTNKETTIFNLPDISVTNNIAFTHYVEETILLLEKNNIFKLLEEYFAFMINKYNADNKLKPNIDNDYIFRDSVLFYNIGCTLEDRVNNINDYFKNKIHYIGPLREIPRLQYDPYIENSANIGIKGENCAGVLFNNKNKIINYLSPSIFLKNDNINNKNYYFLELVNEWLQYIEIAESVDVIFNQRYGYELKINSLSKKTKNDLTNVGVGVSQVLPIILTCLLAKEESTIIIEQPELHLHPAMQTKLADFFIATRLCNKQIIVETHSEYIINRFRQRAIKWPNNNPLENELKIYFTENLDEDTEEFKKGNTVFRPLYINEYAAISEWPKGFFDESSVIADEIFEEASEKWNNRKIKEND